MINRKTLLELLKKAQKGEDVSDRYSVLIPRIVISDIITLMVDDGKLGGNAVYENMTAGEFQSYAQKIKNKIGELNQSIAARKQFVKQTVISGSTPKEDGILKNLREELRATQVEMEKLKEYKAGKAASLEAQRRLDELRAKKIYEKARMETEARDDGDILDSSMQEKADERRPYGKPVYAQDDFESIKGWKKRLIVMLAREVGNDRYHELRRIALYDEKYKNNKYYRETPVFRSVEKQMKGAGK